MKVIISAFTGLGNSILISPLVKGLLKAYGPELQILLVGDDKYLALSILRGLPQTSVHIFKDTDCSLYEGCTVAFFPRFGGSSEFELLIRKKGIKIVKHYDQYLLNPFHKKFSQLARVKLLIKMIFEKKSLYVPYVPGRHEVELNLDLLRQYSSSPIEAQSTQVGVQPKEELITKWNLRSGRYIVLQPSVANGVYSSKRWNPENFLFLAQKLVIAYPHMGIVLLGDLGDKKCMPDFDWPNNTLNLMGETSLEEMVSLINYAKISVVHDSGAMHLAVALKARYLALLGPTDFYRSGPYDKNSSAIYSVNECLAEMHYFNKTENESSSQSQAFYPMSGISVDDVYAKLVTFIN